MMNTLRRQHRVSGRGLVRLLLAMTLAPPAAAVAEDLEIVFLANEGFFIRAGDDAVLIDALFGDGIRGYDAVPEPDRSRLEAASPPYDGVDLVLASHRHADHFDPAAVGRFLAANPSAIFVSTQQAVRILERYGSASSLAESRLRGFWPSEGESRSISVGDIELTVFNLHHGRASDTQNLGLLVEICGRTVLHVGDTEASGHDLRLAGLQGVAPDIALLPSWHLRPGRWEDVVMTLAPELIVAMHLPSRDAPRSYFFGGATDLDSLVELVLNGYPDAFVPLQTGDSIAIPCN